MSAEESYSKSFRFLEQDWENIYDRPKSSIADYLRGMCEFAFFGTIPPKSERARFAGYNAVKSRVMKGRRDTARDTAEDTARDTVEDTARDTVEDTARVLKQEYKNTSPLTCKAASCTRGDVLTYNEVLAEVTGPRFSSNQRPNNPEMYAQWYIEEMRRLDWRTPDGVRMNHGKAIRFIGIKIDDYKKIAPRAAAKSWANPLDDPKNVVDLEGVV